jgi:hypothetical protein
VFSIGADADIYYLTLNTSELVRRVLRRKWRHFAACMHAG